MHNLLCIRVLFCALFVANYISVDSAFAGQVSYSYEGNNFVEVEGDPELFSTSERVTAEFTVDCAAAHPQGDCRNLPYQDYVERGAVDPALLNFSAGPITVPTSNGAINVNRFLFSTDDNALIVDWDMDLYSDELNSFLNVDTDNVGAGLDSAAAPGGGAVVEGNPGSWTKGPLIIVDEFDIAVKKQVSNPVPSDQMQTIEFTIEVGNIGQSMATGVVVRDLLPLSLEIPEGMAAFTSMGYYDPTSGLWEIGDMEAGATPAVMTIPAVVATDTQPACIFNSATADVPGDSNSSNNTSSVALRRPDVDRCVDLEVEVIIWMQDPLACDGASELFYDFLVSNNGPDWAYNVVFEVTETLYKAPGFSLTGSNCEGMRCTWESLYSGQSGRVSASTDIFVIQVPTEHAIELVVSSDIEDYKPENNTVTDQHTLYPVDKISCGGGGMDFSGVGGGGGCFIATATYGTEFHPHVQVLREFRDNVLAKSEWGQALVEFYYRHSPELACRIENSTSLRMLVRGFLLPVVFTVAYPWQALLILILVFALFYVGLRFKHVRFSS